MQIRTATSEDQPAWDQYVLGHPEGLAYQLFAWRLAVKKTYGHDASYLLAENDSKICGVLPLINFGIPFSGSSLISLPYCDAGGILADSADVARLLLERALLLSRESSLKCFIRTTQSLAVNFQNTTDKVRMVLTLPENSELFLASLKSKIRNKIKKPQKCGFAVKIGSHEFIDAFYSVFAENMHELGSPVHSRRWIESIVSEYKEKIRIAVVFTPEGVPAAAGILLLHSTTVSNPWASSLRKYNYLKPNMLLYATLLSFAADNGYKNFDFGRSTPGEGTYLFKEQWGAQPSHLYWYELGSDGRASKAQQQADSPPGGISRNRQLAAQLWQKLPTASANWLGPRIRKYISL